MLEPLDRVLAGQILGHVVMQLCVQLIQRDYERLVVLSELLVLILQIVHLLRLARVLLWAPEFKFFVGDEVQDPFDFIDFFLRFLLFYESLKNFPHALFFMLEILQFGVLKEANVAQPALQVPYPFFGAGYLGLTILLEL